MDYTLTYNNLHIKDSYKVHKCQMRKELTKVRDLSSAGETIVLERSFFSLKMEWICHNFLYKIGYKREQTKDADLDNPCDHPEWMYILGGLAVWGFVW